MEWNTCRNNSKLNFKNVEYETIKTVLNMNFYGWMKKGTNDEDK